MKNLIYKNSNINFTDTGEGKVVVLLHGYLENLSMWNFFVNHFSKKNRIIAIDLLGHGLSDCLGYLHTMEDQADMVFSVLKSLKIKKAVFIGHSMGGYVALAFAEIYPEIMKGLVLLNSTSQSDSEEKKLNRDRAIKVVKQNYVNFVRLSIANLFSVENQTRLNDVIENVKLEALKTPLQGIIAAQEGMKIRKDRELIFRELDCPKLLILGEKDAILECNATINQTINSNIKLITFSGGHMSHIENKVELLIVLDHFLK